MRRGGAVAAVLVALVLGAGCGGRGEPRADIALDGSRRDPDAAGVVSKATTEAITVDGKRYPLSRNLLAFNTYTLEAVPVVGTRGSYVQVGLASGKAVWVAEVARVISSAGGRIGYYRGTVVAHEGDEVVFRDGTVLHVAPGVAVPAPSTAVLAELDVDHDRIARLTGA
jgi:hypothetical protein